MGRGCSFECPPSVSVLAVYNGTGYYTIVLVLINSNNSSRCAYHIQFSFWLIIPMKAYNIVSCVLINIENYIIKITYFDYCKTLIGYDKLYSYTIYQSEPTLVHLFTVSWNKKHVSHVSSGSVKDRETSFRWNRQPYRPTWLVRLRCWIGGVLQVPVQYEHTLSIEWNLAINSILEINCIFCNRQIQLW